jgi:hypothetical protein
MFRLAGSKEIPACAGKTVLFLNELYYAFTGKTIYEHGCSPHYDV